MDDAAFIRSDDNSKKASLMPTGDCPPCGPPKEVLLDLRSIEIFLSICEEGGFTAAADSLGLTQAAVSQHMTKLERELETGLIDRTVRPQRLTAAGQHLQRRGRVLLDDLRLIQSELKHYRNYDIPQLRLGVVESVAGAMLPLIVQKLVGKIGSLSITSGTTHPLMPELLAGNFDLLVTSEQSADNEALHSQCLLVEPLLLILPKDRSPPRNWSEMAIVARDLDFVGYGTRRRIGRTVNRLLERHEIETRGTLTFDSSHGLFDCLRSGDCWGASTPMCLLSAGIQVADFTITTFPDTVPIRSINAIWRAERDGVETDLAVNALRSILAEDVFPKLFQYSGGIPDRLYLPKDAEPKDEAAS
jgi:DNA-binding transcriptional LysR family regulator